MNYFLVMRHHFIEKYHIVYNMHVCSKSQISRNLINPLTLSLGINTDSLVEAQVSIIMEQYFALQKE